MANPNPQLSNLSSYKPKWKSGQTKTIRVPEAIAEQVLSIAHVIDEGGFIVTGDIRQIAAKALKLPSNKGGEIKKCVAQIVRMSGLEVEQNSRKQWTIKQT